MSGMMKNKTTVRSGQARKVFLIGTQLTLRQLFVGLDVLTERIEPVGLLLAKSLKRTHGKDEQPEAGKLFPDLNCQQANLDELLKMPKLLSEIEADEIWVSLPDLYWQRYRTLKPLLDSQLTPWRQVQPLDQWLRAGVTTDSKGSHKRNLIHLVHWIRYPS